MVGWVILFLAIAVVAGILGFTVAAGTAVGTAAGTVAVIAKVLFGVSAVLLAISVVRLIILPRT